MTRVQLRCTGSFRLDAGIRRLHRNHKFAEPLAKTVALSFHHSCRSELTRQGISLGPYSTLSLSGQRGHVTPACRHAVGTISSSDVSDVRRMASEDANQILPGFLAVHRLSDLGDLHQSFTRAMPTTLDPLNTLREFFEIPLLRGSHRMPTEERDNHR